MKTHYRMEMSLSGFEVEILDLIIPGNTLDHPEKLSFVIHEMLHEHKEQLMRNGNISEQDFHILQGQTGTNIMHFLKANNFVYEREGGAYVVTEKIKHLRQQGTLEKYVNWEHADTVRHEQELKTIQARGYLDRDQEETASLHHDNIWKETKSIDNDENLKNHPAMPSHKFDSKPGEISGRGSDKKKTYYPVLIALLVLALAVLAHYFKIV